MKRIPNNILPKFEKVTGIKAKFISAYLSEIDPVTPGRKRCLALERASRNLGYSFTASDWMFNPRKIKEALISNNISTTENCEV